jgi:glycosyltransferase involved in cell wall biosynthesis
MTYKISLIPNPGGLGVYERKLVENLGLPVFTQYFNQKYNYKSEVIEFGSSHRGPFKRARERLSHAFTRPPERYGGVLSTGFIGKEILPRIDQKHIHLSHGVHRGSFGIPPRNSFSDSRVKRFFQEISRSAIRHRERELLSRVDTLVVNSEFTKKVMKHFHNIEADKVIFPPVDTEKYRSMRPVDEDFYLYLGRLADIKKVTDIVRLFNNRNDRLVVAGKGPNYSKINKIAGDNIELVGYVDEKRKRELMGRCKGFIQNSIAEDFGITTIEAMASGAPVIAVSDGNNPNIISDEKNGILFSTTDNPKFFKTETDFDSFDTAVNRANSFDWDHKQIERTAEPYDVNICINKWKNVLDSV